VQVGKTILDVLSGRADSDDLAYVFLGDGTSATETRWTFAETARNSSAFAVRLSSHGVGVGDRVVLAVNPGLGYIAALYGIMQLGAIPVPCFPPLRPKELSRFRAISLDSAAAAIVIDEVYRQPMRELRSQLRACELAPAVLYESEPPADATASANPSAFSPADLALIQYTSGSTGSPKGVCVTHDNLVSNCAALGRSMGGDPDRVGLSWLPPYHDMGLMGTIILSLYHGWPLVLMSPLHFVQQPLRWLRAITDYRVSITVGPNFSLELCAAALADGGDTDDIDLSTVRQLYCGAEPICADTLERFLRRTAPLGFDPDALIPCYGMAETTLFVSGRRAGTRYRVQRPAQPSGTPVVSCGAVDSEHNVRIIDPAGRTTVADGVVGEIWVAGRSVAAGYYRRPELTAEVFGGRLENEGGVFLRTGDLGFLCGDELFVTGRTKDLIIVHGRNLYPQDIEAAVVRSDPSLRKAVAFDVTGSGGVDVVVIAETDPAVLSTESKRNLIERIRASVVEEFGVSPQVHLVSKGTVPTTTSGKVCRRDAKRMLLANELTSHQLAPSQKYGAG
jgi:acyl-CoA synthetase (AMP-forming)/AMP-acid ligase II